MQVWCGINQSELFRARLRCEDSWCYWIHVFMLCNTPNVSLTIWKNPKFESYNYVKIERVPRYEVRCWWHYEIGLLIAAPSVRGKALIYKSHSENRHLVKEWENIGEDALWQKRFEVLRTRCKGALCYSFCPLLQQKFFAVATVQRWIRTRALHFLCPAENESEHQHNLKNFYVT